MGIVFLNYNEHFGTIFVVSVMDNRYAMQCNPNQTRGMQQKHLFSEDGSSEPFPAIQGNCHLPLLLCMYFGSLIAKTMDPDQTAPIGAV